MSTRGPRQLAVALAVALAAAASARAQFLDAFDGPAIPTDPEGLEGWAFLTISRPVLQRLVDGRTLGLAIRPLGAVVASFEARDAGGRAPRLLFDVED